MHESSYLPFLFSETDDVRSDPGDNAAVKKTTGRRIFNKKGEMVAVGVGVRCTALRIFSYAVPCQSSDTGTTFPSAPEEPASQASSSSRKVHPRPVSISASGSSGHLRGFDQLTKPKDGKVSKSAREAIFESGGVGTDLKTETRKNPGLTATTTFLKPVGVDDPKQSQRASTTPASIKSEDVIDGARQKKKSKRDREVGDATEDGKRLKKNRINPE